MKSICIKTNNTQIINYLLDNYAQINLDYVYISSNSFKIYNNIIIHYIGNDLKKFNKLFSEILTNCIINYYEIKIVKWLINYNYFYFNDIEKKHILNICSNMLLNNTSLENRKEKINNSISKYILNNKSMVLDGFVTFRMKDYIKIIDNLVDECVNNFLIEKEYSEFVDILKIYVASTPSKISIVHLVYIDNEAYLLDNEKNIIPTDDDIFNAKYLSDITFSSNDYVLNTLLNLIPKKIIIHSETEDFDDFLTTIKLIFNKKVVISKEKIILNKT